MISADASTKTAGPCAGAFVVVVVVGERGMGRAWLAASASVSRSGTPSASASRMAESAAAAPAGGTSFSSSPWPSSTVFTLSVWQ